MDYLRITYKSKATGFKSAAAPHTEKAALMFYHKLKADGEIDVTLTGPLSAFADELKKAVDSLYE